MTSWKTTVFGLAMAIGLALQGGIGGTPNDTWWKIGSILQVIGAAGLGATSKDHNVTGGTKSQ